MRAMSGASLTLTAMLTLGTIVSSACSQVGVVQARRSFKAANAEYQAQNYPKAAELYEDALKNGLSEAQAEAWRDNVAEWLRALVDVIETSGGAEGGHA